MKFFKYSTSHLTPFARLLTSEVLNTTSSSVLLVATPLIAITILGADTAEVGILAAAGTAAPLILGLSAGAIADQLDRSKVLLWCGITRLLFLAALPFLFYFEAVSLATLCVVNFGISGVKLLFDSVVAAVIPTIVERDSLTKANSWYEAATSTAYTLGPAIAGWLLQATSAPFLYSANAVLYMASTFFVKSIVLPRVATVDASNRSHLSHIAAGVKLLWKHEIQRTVALAAGMFNLFHTGFLTIFSVYALRFLNFSAVSFGMLISTVGLAGLLGAVCATNLISRLGARTALVGSLLIIGPLGIPILFAENLPFLQRAVLIAVCLAAWDFLVVIHVIIEQTVRQLTVHNSQLSRITATTRFVGWGADPIGALLAGLAATSPLGIKGTLATCLVGFLISGSVLLTSKGIRKLNDINLGSGNGTAAD